MFRIRFHGRGGQGMKTASRILGTAFFLEGYETQDAPRYGAERRGAPIFAYVRASHRPIFERGIIRNPDLVIVADDTLVSVPAAKILAGTSETTCLLIRSNVSAQEWKRRLHFPGILLTIPVASGTETIESHFLGVICAGAAARLIGRIKGATIEQAIQQELASLESEVVAKNILIAMEGYNSVAGYEGVIPESSEFRQEFQPVSGWIELPFETAAVAAPAIHAATTSEAINTGLWRTLKPVIDYERCKHCWWICSSFCPDNAITVTAEGRPEIDYDHCKGCMICVVQCPTHANQAVVENSTPTKSKEGESA